MVKRCLLEAPLLPNIHTRYKRLMGHCCSAYCRGDLSRRQRKGSSALDQSEERPDERHGRGENDNILSEFEGLVGFGQNRGKIIAVQQSVHVCSQVRRVAGAAMS